MGDHDKVNILLVDDQPAKLLSLDVILQPLNENILRASTGDEALRHLLQSDVAVVLMDVCMPEMDGFALAEMIREHPRFGRTAIIFISAVHLTDADRLRGYGLGAVDYIPVPIIPEVLRAKVAVFAELYRKTEQLNTINRDLEKRVAERTAELERSNLIARESEARFRTLADNMAQLAWMAHGDGSVFWLNRRWHEFTGLSHEDSIGAGWTRSLHPDDSDRIVSTISECFRTGKAWEETFQTRASDGTFRWFLTRAFPIADERGRVMRWFGTGTDVTEQREAQQVLARDRETLERLVIERTKELERSNERLRLSERMATIGTLATGLGHDIGNLLLPVRLRLDSLDAALLPDSAREDVAAVRKAAEYLQRLSGSLRLLALDSSVEDHGDARTDVCAWWRDSEGMMRNGIPQPVALASELAPDLPAVRIGKAGLTQVVFNLVQNAGDALAGRSDGRVVVSAAQGTPGRTVVITVMDNGPGMTEEARRRCLEPFFTTKARELSTGLGLPLVSAIVARVQGSLSVASSPGKGASFRIELPVAAARAPALPASPCRQAVVMVRDARLRAHVVASLAPLGVVVHDAPTPDADVWVADADNRDAIEAIREGEAGRPDQRVILFSKDGSRTPNLPRAVVVDSRTRLSEVRGALGEALSRLDEPALERA